MDHNPAYFILAALIPIGLVGAPIAIAAILSYHRRQLRFREQCTELVREMLAKKMSVDDIERVIAAWRNDPRWAKQMLKRMKREGIVALSSPKKVAKV